MKTKASPENQTPTKIVWLMLKVLLRFWAGLHGRVWTTIKKISLSNIELSFI